MRCFRQLSLLVVGLIVIAPVAFSSAIVKRYPNDTPVTVSTSSDLTGYLTDAPADGFTYGRKNNTWSPASTGGSMVWPASAGIAVASSNAWSASISGTSSQFVKGDASLDSTTYLASVTANSPLTGAGTSASHLSIPVATASVNGYLATADFSAFSGKQAALNGTGFVKATGTSISYDNSTYLTSYTETDPIVASQTNGFTITRGTTPATLTVAASGSVSGSNTGDQTLASLGAQAALNGTGFVKATGTSISYDPSTYLTSVTAHNLLSATHGDTATGSVVRGDLMYGNATPKWDRLAFPATPTGKVIQATATDVAWSSNPLTIGASASVSGSNTGDQTSSTLSTSVLGSPTYTKQQDITNGTQASGKISGFTITQHAGGTTVDVSSGEGMIKVSNSSTADTKFFTFAGVTSVALTDSNLNFLYVDYNGGTPQILVTTDRTTVHDYDQFVIGRVYRSGTDSSEISNTGMNIDNFSRRVHNKELEKYGIDHISGAVVSESGTRLLATTAGIWYIGETRYTTPTKNSGTAGLDLYYYNGSSWVLNAGSTASLGNTQYNNIASGLSNFGAGANHWGIYWIYICTQGDMYVLYGQADYTSLATAQAAQPPATLPNYVSTNTRLAAKAIFQKSATNFTEVDSAWITPFNSSLPTDHNSLSGLQGGTAGEYYHLTSAEYTATATTGSGNMARLTSPQFTTPNIGTATGSITGNAATVTTNANLTGPITSTGNATAVAAQSGTGSAFVMASAPTIYNAVLSGTATGSVSGNAATVTTNANLTGPITSVGNATSVAAQSGSGTAFVMASSPTIYSASLSTPALGTPASGTLTSCTGLPLSGVVSSTSTALGVGSIELGHASDTTLARVSAGVMSVENVTVDTISAANTLTNKRITPRVSSATSYTTDTGTSLNIDSYDQFIVTAQAGALKFNNPSGTPTDGQKLIIAVTGTAARALTWDTQFAASTVALPTTTVGTARLTIGFIWSAASSTWICVAAA